MKRGFVLWQKAVTDGLEAEGIDRDYFGFYDLNHLFERGHRPEHVVAIAVADQKKQQAGTPA